jgi:RNA polymerase-binding protein DksA
MSIAPETNDGETVTERDVQERKGQEKKGDERNLDGRAAARGSSKPSRGAKVDGSRNGLEAVRGSLLRKREEILNQQSTQLNALLSPDKHHLADLEEMSSDTDDSDSLCALVEMGNHTLEQVEAALEKIEEGTYGTCEVCEKSIAPERLEALPFAALCLDCQRQRELLE